MIYYNRFFVHMYRFFFDNMNGLKPVVRCGVVLVGIAQLGGCRREPADRIAELRDLARHPGPPQLRRIESAFVDADRDVRATSLVLLSEVAPERGQELARRGLDDADGVVRAAAVRVLAPHLDAPLTERLAVLAAGDPVWQVRSNALEALSGSEGDSVRQAFERGASDGNPEVRRAALVAGARRPGLLPFPVVAQILAADEAWENRVLAAQILGASGDPAAYAGLDEAVRDGHEFVRAAASRERQILVRSGAVRPTPPPASPAPDTTKRPPGV